MVAGTKHRASSRRPQVAVQRGYREAIHRSVYAAPRPPPSPDTRGMREHDFLPKAAQLLVPVAELISTGLSRRTTRTQVARGELVRVRPGYYVLGDRWRELKLAEQHLIAIVAAHRAASRPPLFSHRSAATLMRAPIWSAWLARLANQVAPPGATSRTYQQPEPRITHARTAPPRTAPSSQSLIRHSSASLPEKLELSAGITCTDLARTAVDLARSEPFVIALACVDVLLHHEFTVRNEVDVAVWRAWQQLILQEVSATPGARGNIAVRALARFADPGSGSPLESVSRLRMLQLGVDFESQRRVHGSRGQWLYVDFWFRGLALFGECDGRMKYFEEEMLTGRSLDEVRYDEKRRQEYIEGSTQSRGIRWGAPEAETPASFARMCREYGIPFRGRPDRHLDRDLTEFLVRQP